MDDLSRRVGRREDDFKEIRTDLKAIRADMADVKGQLRRIEGRFTGIEGRLTGIEGRFSQIPTVTHFILFVLAVLAPGGVMQWMARPDISPPAVSQTAPR